MKKIYFVLPKNYYALKYFKDVWFNPFFVLYDKDFSKNSFTIRTSTVYFRPSNRLEIVYNTDKKNYNWIIFGIY